jgi:multimeric flavodoxin WrbA
MTTADAAENKAQPAKAQVEEAARELAADDLRTEGQKEMTNNLREAGYLGTPTLEDDPRPLRQSGDDAVTLSAFALNCSLKSSAEASSTDKLLGEVFAALESHGVSAKGTVRVADHLIRPGVSSDEGDGDEWPALRQQILDADIFVLGTPIWMGHPSSHAQRVLERLDAFLGETDRSGRMVSLDRVAIVAVVGNEDGAHHVAAELFQALSDVGFTIPAAGMTYWVGEAMHKTDYKDLPSGSDKTDQATKTAAANAAHLARLLAAQPYPS